MTITTFILPFIAAALLLVACDSNPENAVADQALEEVRQSKPRIETSTRKGGILFLQCAACHAVTADASPKVGPNLHCVLNRQAAALPDFTYSSALIASGRDGLMWDHSTLMAFLENPKILVPDNSMAFGGLSKAQDREAIIQYLSQACDEASR